MDVYQTDIDGVFVGITTADQDPLDQSNVLIPAGCVGTAPPEYTENQFVRWTGSAWVVEDVPVEEPVEEPEPVAADVLVRGERNALLTATDWMALSDVQMTTEMQEYRQALRDIPSQAGFPHNVTWPTLGSTT